MNQVNKEYSRINTSKISVAPMMDWTDRHCRYFHRLISPNTALYTEMVTTGALIHGDTERFMRHSDQEHPVVLQLGGSDHNDLAKCARIGEDHGFDEINLNCGCPSPRVQKGYIGAILMQYPDIVAKAVEAMGSTVSIPVTVKCRIGIDDYDSFEFIDKFITTVKQAGCKHFIIHARKALLDGLSPKENRHVPPINYERAAQIRANHPELTLSINGEIKTAEQVKNHLLTFDSAMIGREAYQNPYILNQIEQEIYATPQDKLLSRVDVALSMIPYIEEQMCLYGTPVKSITRHMTGLFQGQRGANKWRQVLSTLPHKDNVSAKEVIETGLSAITSTE